MSFDVSESWSDHFGMHRDNCSSEHTEVSTSGSSLLNTIRKIILSSVDETSI